MDTNVGQETSSFVPDRRPSSVERPPAFTTPVRRRNGELQACEPCRKRKLKCDHGFPTCSRCLKRAGIDKCVYHPAPLTKRPAQVSQRSSVSEQSSTVKVQPESPYFRNSIDMGPPGPPGPPRPPTARSASPTRSKRTPSSTHGTTETTLSLNALPGDPRKTGFIGHSSYASVVDEINANLGVRGQDDGQPPLEPIAEDKINRGAEVLSYLKDIKFYEQLVERWLGIGSGYVVYAPIYRIWLDGIKLFFGISGYDVTLSQDLVDLSKLVWRNTQQPLRADALTTARQWAIQSTGDKLRWERLGMIFSTVGIVSGTLNRWDPIFTSNQDKFKDRFALLKTTLGLVDACIALSQECGEPNEITVCLLYESVFLIQRIKGETSFEAWRRMSEVCDYAIALGLHQDKRVDPKSPFFLRELRVRMYSQIYSYDKFMSIHLGRPPRLTYRHSVLQLPFDLSDEEVCYEEPALSKVIAALDSNGWSVNRRRNRVTWRRAWQGMLPLREDILEIAIGSYVENIDERVTEIRNKIDGLFSKWPSFLMADPDEIMARIRTHASFTPPGSSEEFDQFDTISCLSIHSIMRHTEFLLERAIVHRKKCNPAGMIVSARALLTLTLQLFSLKDYLSDYGTDMVVMLSLYGVPSAGVLGIELLKQDQAKDHMSFHLPRSEIIQQLSVLISALASVHPDEGGNYAIAAQGLTALQGLLDKILSPKPAATEHTGVDEQTLLHSFPPELATSNDADFVQWLNNVEWQGDNWLESFGTIAPEAHTPYVHSGTG